jgi:hypothetical protein
MVDQLTLEGRALPICPYGADKKPTCRGGFNSASTDPMVIDELWRRWPGPLTGVRTGEASGLAVLDIDTKNDGEAWLADFYGFDWPRTRCHSTRSGGLHFVFKTRPGLRCSEGRIAPVDIRADGGAVIWWPSAGYRVLCEGPVAPWPASLDEALAEAEERRRQRFNRLCGLTGEAQPDVDTPTPPSFAEPIAYELNYARRSLDNAYCELYMCRGGRRNELLNVLAYKMGRLIVRGWIKRERVEEWLLRACGACGLLDDPDDGPAKCRATIASGIEAGMQRPYHDIRWRVKT